MDKTLKINVSTDPKVNEAILTLTEFLENPGKFLKVSVEPPEIISAEDELKTTGTSDALSRSN